LRDLRISKRITQVDLTLQTGIDAGVIVHYQDPENFGVALLDDNGSGTVTPRWVEFVDGRALSRVRR
jgi:hypothetical protein